MSIKTKLLNLLGRTPYSVERLRAAGVTVGDNVYCGSRRIDLDHGFLIKIGDDVVLSDCRILCHDASTKRPLGYSRVGRVIIGNHVYVGADAIIMPGVKIGDYSIIGAGAIVTKDVPAHSVAVGCPAKVISTYEDYISKCKKMMDDGAPIYTTYSANKSKEEKLQMQTDLMNGGIGFDV